VADARLKLTASEIEAILLAELGKKFPDTRSVSTIRKHSPLQRPEEKEFHMGVGQDRTSSVA
jgi:hypothetical protein